MHFYTLTGDIVNDYENSFLFLLKTHINNEKLPDGYHFDIGRVFSLAGIHNVLPMIYSAAEGSSEDIILYRQKVKNSVAFQMMKNANFSHLYNNIIDNSIEATVLKGVICSSAYPNPDYRLSSDFDIVVKEEDRSSLHDFLLSEGFFCKGDNYLDESTGLYIEVSTSLGEGDGWIKDTAERVFDGFFDRCISVDGFRTLSHTDHFVYLIYHAFKHFIGSGFGVRQIIDIFLFVKKYNAYIDYERSKEMLSEMNAFSFACNIFLLIEKYFDYIFDGFDYKNDQSALCPDDFLADLLSAGVFGKSSEDRLHSASLVLSAVNDNGNKSVLKTVFPSYKIMKSKFAFLKYLPFLLPVMWIYRLVVYLFKLIGKKKNVSPVRTIEIAESRIELLKTMGIIK